MEKAMATHSSTSAWQIPWTEEPGGLQSTGSLGVPHDWATLLSLFTFMHWKRTWQPTPVFLPGESHWGAWWAAVSGVTQSRRTQLKWLSSSSSAHRVKASDRHELFWPHYLSIWWHPSSLQEWKPGFVSRNQAAATSKSELCLNPWGVGREIGNIVKY